MKLNCEKIREITLMYADCIDEINDESAKKEYFEHLKTCKECRAERDEILNDIAALHSFGEDIPTKNGLTITESVMKSVKAINSKPKRWRFRYTGTVAAAVIAAVILIGAGNPIFQSMFNGQKTFSEDSATPENYTIENDTDESKLLREAKGEEFRAITRDNGENSDKNSDETTKNPQTLKMQSTLQPQNANENGILNDTSNESSESIEAAENSEKGTESANLLMKKADVQDIDLNEEETLKMVLKAENERVGQCTVHPKGYHTITYEYAKLIGLQKFNEWCASITDEEVMYTPEYFREYFKEYFPEN